MVSSCARWQLLAAKRDAVETELARLKTNWIQANSTTAEKLSTILKKPLAREYSQLDLLKRPELDYAKMQDNIEGFGEGLTDSVKQQVEIQAKYSGYIDRQKDEIERNKKQQNVVLPTDIDYSVIGGLSNEIIQKLQAHQPETIGQASRISGVTPAAISLLLITLKKKNYKKILPASQNAGGQ